MEAVPATSAYRNEFALLVFHETERLPRLTRGGSGATRG